MLLSYVVDDVFVPNSTSMRRNRKKFSLNKTSDDLIFCFIPSRDSISFHFVGSMNQDKNVSFFFTTSNLNSNSAISEKYSSQAVL